MQKFILLTSILCTLWAACFASPTDSLSVEETATPLALVSSNLHYYSGANNEEKRLDLVRQAYSDSCKVSFFVGPNQDQLVTIGIDYFLGLVADQNRGMWERALVTEDWQFGKVATVRQSYELRLEEDGEVYAKGINVYTLAKEAGRWYITHLTWYAEDESNSLPEDFLSE